MSFDLRDYPPLWRFLSLWLRFVRAGNCCECQGECGKDHGGRCRAEQGHPLSSGYRVVLSVAHLWRGPCAEHYDRGVKCGDPDHLAVMCQRCHLLYDLPHHLARARRERKAVGDLFTGP